jgi:hypothetical protein
VRNFVLYFLLQKGVYSDITVDFFVYICIAVLVHALLLHCRILERLRHGKGTRAE